MVLNLRKIQYHPFEPVFADLALLLDAAKTGICSADIHEPIKTKNPTAYWLWDFNLAQKEGFEPSRRFLDTLLP